MVNIIDNKITKIIIIGFMMILMLVMICTFPTSKASTNEEPTVSIR